jgi:hypothetical protein
VTDVPGTSAVAPSLTLIDKSARPPIVSVSVAELFDVLVSVMLAEVTVAVFASVPVAAPEIEHVAV